MNQRYLRARRIQMAVAVSAIIFSAAAPADERDWWIHVGAGHVDFRESAALKIAGQKVQNGNVSATNNTTAIFEVGYQFSPYFSTSLTFGVPPTSKIKGAGSISGAGHLGSVRYAPAMLIGQYWLPVSDYVKPYIGAGVVYYSALRSKDGALQNLEVDNGWGTVLQAGFEVPITPRIGFFLDIKKIYINIDGSGNLPQAGNAPVTTNVKLNPVILHSGVSISF